MNGKNGSKQTLLLNNLLYSKVGQVENGASTKNIKNNTHIEIRIDNINNKKSRNNNDNLMKTQQSSNFIAKTNTYVQKSFNKIQTPVKNPKAANNEKVNTAFNYQTFNKNVKTNYDNGKIAGPKKFVDKTEINLQSSAMSKAYLTSSTTTKKSEKPDTRAPNTGEKKVKFTEISIDTCDLDKKVNKTNSHLEKQLANSYAKSYQKRDVSSRTGKDGKVDVKSRNNKNNIEKGDMYNTDNLQHGKSLSFDKTTKENMFHTIKKDQSTKNNQTNTVQRKANEKLQNYSNVQPKIHISQSKFALKPQKAKVFIQKPESVVSSVFSSKVALSTKCAPKLIVSSSQNCKKIDFTTKKNFFK